jgi:hypothetical protein
MPSVYDAPATPAGSKHALLGTTTLNLRITLYILYNLEPNSHGL